MKINPILTWTGMTEISKCRHNARLSYGTVMRSNMSTIRCDECGSTVIFPMMWKLPQGYWRVFEVSEAQRRLLKQIQDGGLVLSHDMRVNLDVLDRYKNWVTGNES